MLKKTSPTRAFAVATAFSFSLILGADKALAESTVIPLTSGNFGWVYESPRGLQGPGSPAANTLNLTTYAGGYYASILPAAAPATTDSSRSFLRFDVSGLVLAPGSTVLLNLNSVGNRTPEPRLYNPGFGVTPFADAPALVGITALTSAWTSSNLSWLNQPTLSANPDLTRSFVVDAYAANSGLTAFYSVDITSIVESWIATPSTNFGLALSLLVPPGEEPNNLLPIFSSGASPNSIPGSTAFGPAPFLQVNAIPEPSFSLVIMGLASLPLVRRRAAR